MQKMTFKKYILLASIAGKFAHTLKKICQENNLELRAVFITTAANLYTKKQWMEDDIALFEDAGFLIKRVDISSLSKKELTEELNKVPLCIMGGGNPVYLLEEMKQKDTIKLLQEKVAAGMLYVGSSAGAVVASNTIELEKHFEDRADVQALDSYASLGFINFQVLPHWGKAGFAKQYMHMLKDAYAKEQTVISLNDDQALEIIDDQMKLLTLAK